MVVGWSYYYDQHHHHYLSPIIIIIYAMLTRWPFFSALAFVLLYYCKQEKRSLWRILVEFIWFSFPFTGLNLIKGCSRIFKFNSAALIHVLSPPFHSDLRVASACFVVYLRRVRSLTSFLSFVCLYIVLIILIGSSSGLVGRLLLFLSSNTKNNCSCCFLGLCVTIFLC